MRGGYPITTFTHLGTDVPTSNTTIFAGTSKLMSLEIQNQGGASVYIRLDGGVAVADKTAFRILPGQTYWARQCPAGAVTAISESGTNAVHVVTGAPPA